MLVKHETKHARRFLDQNSNLATYFIRKENKQQSQNSKSKTFSLLNQILILFTSETVVPITCKKI